MGSGGCGQSNGAANGTAVATNRAFTKFLFVLARADDDAHGARLRAAGSNIARGFFNDFDIDDARDTQAQRFETIQFFVREVDAPADCHSPCIQKARHMMQSRANTVRACRRSMKNCTAALATAPKSSRSRGLSMSAVFER